MYSFSFSLQWLLKGSKYQFHSTLPGLFCHDGSWNKWSESSPINFRSACMVFLVLWYSWDLNFPKCLVSGQKKFSSLLPWGPWCYNTSNCRLGDKGLQERASQKFLKGVAVNENILLQLLCKKPLSRLQGHLHTSLPTLKLTCAFCTFSFLLSDGDASIWFLNWASLLQALLKSANPWLASGKAILLIFHYHHYWASAIYGFNIPFRCKPIFSEKFSQSQISCKSTWSAIFASDHRSLIMTRQCAGRNERLMLLRSSKDLHAPPQQPTFLEASMWPMNNRSGMDFSYSGLFCREVWSIMFPRLYISLSFRTASYSMLICIVQSLMIETIWYAPCRTRGLRLLFRWLPEPVAEKERGIITSPFSSVAVTRDETDTPISSGPCLGNVG